MNFRLLTAFFGFVALASIAAAQEADTLTPAPSETAAPGGMIAGRYLIEVAPGVDPRAVAPSHGVAPDFVYLNAVRGFAGAVPPGRLAALARDPRVARIVPDRAVSAIAKPGSGGGTPTPPPTQVVPASVQRINAAPGTNPETGAGVGVAVLDTGIDLAHTDLQPLGALSYSAFGGSAQDNNGHGTHVAGSIAARNNTLAVVGVAPGATIYPVKVLDGAGNGSDAGVTAGLDWVLATAAIANPPIRVVNMSLGRAGSLNDNPLQRAAIQNLVAAGITVVVAAGNDARLEVSGQVPAGYPEVIAVGSTTALAGTNQYRFFNGVIAKDTASYFTSDGAFDPATGIGVSVSAPGEDQENINKAGQIQSVGVLSTKLGGGTTRMSGTSMASPHTAGVVALIWQKAIALGQTPTSEEIRARIRSGATQQNVAPLNSPTTSYSFDGVREGVLSATGALAF